MSFSIQPAKCLIGDTASQDIQGVSHKAIAINLEPKIYGTFAEIGAGQETARWFFRVGGASGTIAKSISAYDMAFSDAIYGATDRYVSRVRLRKMLDHEFDLLQSRLDERCGIDTRFFAFANTVAARSYKGNKECHGWLGVRFLREPRGEMHEIIVHVRMLDRENLQQQEALGIMGVNLLYAAYFYADDIDTFTSSLLDDLSPDRIETDLVLFSGKDFEKIDNRLVNFLMLKKGLTRSIVIAPNGEVLQAADHLYGNAVLLERGNFRPVTKVNIDMLHAARAKFVPELNDQHKKVVEIMEITLHNLLDGANADPADFLARIEILGMLGKTVMISNYAEFHRLTGYLRVCTHEKIGIVLGVDLLRELFKEKYYTDLEGGILEAFGRLFKNDVQLLIYPSLSATDNQLLSVDNFPIEVHLAHLYHYLYSNHYIQGIDDNEPKTATFTSREVIKRIQECDDSWEQYVLPEVADVIKKRAYFGWKKSCEAADVS